MTFEVGKFYRHASGRDMAIVGEVNTTMWGRCLVGEQSNNSYLQPVGIEEGNAQGWTEITEEEWKKNFS